MQGRMAGLDDILALDDDNEDDLVDDQTEETIENVMLELIDEISLGLCFEVHRASRNGTVFLDETDRDSVRQYEIVGEKGVDVFGQVPMKKQLECVCPNCSRNLAASRFAPHLEKCMGMGRNSSRIASRRIASNSGKKGDSDNDSENDNDNDNDWSYVADKKAKKLKKDKTQNSPRRSKSASKVKNGDIPSVGSNTSDGSGSTIPPYESMSLDERKTLLTHTCGVISEHTKKLCTRSHRCPQHTDAQRRAVRSFLLGQHGSLADDDIVDIDTYDDADTQVLRDSLQWEASSNPSPADSNSTVNSTSSRKWKSTKSKKKRSNNSGMSNNLYDFV